MIGMIVFTTLALFAWEMDFATFAEVGAILAAAIGALWLWKSGIPSKITESTSKLVELRTTERDDALKKVARLEAEIEMMEKHEEFLNAEIKQRTEIWFLDQAELQKLRAKVNG